MWPAPFLFPIKSVSKILIEKGVLARLAGSITPQLGHPEHVEISQEWKNRRGNEVRSCRLRSLRTLPTENHGSASLWHTQKESCDYLPEVTAKSFLRVSPQIVGVSKTLQCILCACVQCTWIFVLIEISNIYLYLL